MHDRRGGILTLHGMRIIESAAFIAVPYAGMTLAQMGADVIRVDRLQGGLDAHRWPVTATGESLFWAGMNKGKRSLAIDLASAEGQEIVAALITAPGPDSGMFLTNLRGRGVLDYPALSKARADLIMVSLSGGRCGGDIAAIHLGQACGAMGDALCHSLGARFQRAIRRCRTGKCGGRPGDAAL